jgi:DNA-directed RNA polymerase specialized sigma subunit
MPRKKLRFETASDDEIALLSKYGDSEALSILWQSVLPTINRIAGYFHAKYPWIEQEDIAQSIALEVPKIVRRFNPARATHGVKRYFYFAFYRAAQDTLRREDPLGVRIPRKRRYPPFAHLTSIPHEFWGVASGGMDEIISGGLNNLDRGYPAYLDPP